ncbi:MAG: hypothetical protein GF411_20010, partial [Candidatus Lokiarchaeota archaeon]|nr:hypothetical protein [Candidatus Lokiarchaeota archaeon]
MPKPKALVELDRLRQDILSMMSMPGFPSSSRHPITRLKPDTAQDLDGPAERGKIEISRIIRNTAMSQALKKIYNYSCQICGTSIDRPSGPYCEVHHIVPLGGRHNGPDSDGEGLSDDLENYIYGTDPNDGDTDNDGLSDANEIRYHNTNP